MASRQAVELWPESLDAAAVQRLATEQPLAALLLSVTSLLATGMALAGVGLTIWGLGTGRLRSLWRFPAARLPSWSMQELGRMLMLILLVAGLMPFARLALLSYEPRWELDARLWVPVSMTLLDLFVILTVLAFAEGKRAPSAWQAVGLSPRRWWESIRMGLRSYVTAFPWLFLLLSVITAVARVLHLEPPAEPLQELIFQEHRLWVFAVTVVLACTVGPVAEECFFRGVLYPALRTKTSRWVAMLVSGGLFGMIHTNVIGFLPIMLLGCLLAYIYERSGSLAGSIAVHVLHNSLLMGMAIAFRFVPSA